MSEDQDEAFRRIWQTFRTFDRLEDGRHDTAVWRSHEGLYALCLIRVPAATLQPELDECRGALNDHPFIRVHPDGFLHVTLQELGFVCDEPRLPDEITPERLEEFTAATVAAIADRPAFNLALGGLNSFQDAVFLDVHDDGQCARLHGRIFDLAAIARAPRFSYLPHTTIAHYTRRVPVPGLAAALAPWRDITFGSFRVTEVEVATLRVDEPYPPLETFAVIPLRD